jgi:hypothetical protein
MDQDYLVRLIKDVAANHKPKAVPLVISERPHDQASVVHVAGNAGATDEKIVTVKPNGDLEVHNPQGRLSPPIDRCAEREVGFRVLGRGGKYPYLRLGGNPAPGSKQESSLVALIRAALTAHPFVAAHYG